MNTNPSAKRILCFGDSNTWGRKPGDDNSARFGSDVRWTGVLQNQLGDHYEVLEEGLNGRTTNLDSPDKPGKNGAEYLFPCLESASPIDMIVLQLGKNNFKTKYHASPEDIVSGLEDCIRAIKKEGRDRNGKVPQVILLPILPVEEKEYYSAGRKEISFQGAKEKSLALLPLYASVARKQNFYFADITQIASVSEADGIHIDGETHSVIGKYLADIIRDLT